MGGIKDKHFIGSGAPEQNVGVFLEQVEPKSNGYAKVAIGKKILKNLAKRHSWFGNADRLTLAELEGRLIDIEYELNKDEHTLNEDQKQQIRDVFKELEEVL